MTKQYTEGRKSGSRPPAPPPEGGVWISHDYYRKIERLIEAATHIEETINEIAHCPAPVDDRCVTLGRALDALNENADE